MAGKTGTAQNGVNNTGLNDAVFTCYAPYDNHCDGAISRALRQYLDPTSS